MHQKESIMWPHNALRPQNVQPSRYAGLIQGGITSAPGQIIRKSDETDVSEVWQGLKQGIRPARGHDKPLQGLIQRLEDI